MADESHTDDFLRAFGVLAGAVTPSDGDAARYAAARAHVEETQGNLFREKAWWQFFALLLAGLLLVSLVGLIWLGRQPALDPYYLVVNDHGQFRVVGWDDYQHTDQEIKRDLLLWIRCARGLPADLPTLERCWQIVPLFLRKGSQAYGVVQAYYRELEPKKQLFRLSIDIQEARAYPHPDGRWQVQWREDWYQLPRRGGEGRLERQTSYTAIMLVTRQKPTRREEVELHGEPVNPLGLRITHLAWGER